MTIIGVPRPITNKNLLVSLQADPGGAMAATSLAASVRDNTTFASVPATKQISPDRTAITLVPAAPLAANRSHSIVINTLDAAGNSVNQVVSSFTTGP